TGGPAPPRGGRQRPGLERRRPPAPRARADRNVLGVTVPIRDAMMVYRGNPPVRIRPAMTLSKDGVNLSQLCLGSHTGTHIDAPSHFIRGGAGADRLALDRFIGPAWVADLRRVKGGITADDLRKARIPGGSRRVLLRTSNSRSWHPARAFRRRFVYLYPDGADWIVERGSALVGRDDLCIEGSGSHGARRHSRRRGQRLAQ